MTGSGDPASLSAAGGLLLRLSSGLGSDASRTAAAYAALQGEWVGRASVAARRRGDLLAAAAAVAAEETARVGALLQQHSTELARLLDDEADVRARAAAAGLDLTEAGVVPAPGVRGVADRAEVARTEATRAELDALWREVHSRVATSRTALRVALDDSAQRLDRAATSLRLH